MPENNKNGNNTSKSNNSENGSDDLLDLSSIDKLRKKYGVYEDEDSTEKISLPADFRKNARAVKIFREFRSMTTPFFKKKVLILPITQQLKPTAIN